MRLLAGGERGAGKAESAMLGDRSLRLRISAASLSPKPLAGVVNLLSIHLLSVDAHFGRAQWAMSVPQSGRVVQSDGAPGRADASKSSSSHYHRGFSAVYCGMKKPQPF